jgi:DNA-binding transcriptional LysR family regulator
MRGTDFVEMSAFAVIAEQRSFANAAVQLGVARSTLSQNIRSLEERLGVRLFNRTTRSVSLTEAGERLLARVRPALAELSAAKNEVETLRKGPIGLVRLVVQPPVATLFMGPLLGKLLEEYPDITLDMAVERMPRDIVSGRFDAGIRVGEQVDRDMIAMRVMNEARFVVVASPKYLARHPAPRTPEDLRHHNCIRSMLPNGTARSPFKFLQLHTPQASHSLVGSSSHQAARPARRNGRQYCEGCWTGAAELNKEPDLIGSERKSERIRNALI